MPKYEEILAKFKKYDQQHILVGYEKLFGNQQEELLEDCAKIDFRWLAERWAEFSAVQEGGIVKKPIEPAPVVPLPNTDGEKAKAAEARERGEELLRQGKVAAFLVAGGQGTRLGFDGPKGAYPIGPISGKTLFQWHAEQISARATRYRTSIPWYIMTSQDNDRDTRHFFEENDYFGLSRRNVFFFVQDMVPCLDFSGKLMLASPSRLAMNPNGHGGSLSGLKRSGAIKDMRNRGIEFISYFQVDNPLVTICDPLFIGLHAASGAEMSSKVLEKSSPSERIGVVCLRDGRPAVVEYTDLDPETMEEADENGRLKYWAGSIAIHMINVDFADKVGADDTLPWHFNKKKVPFFTGNRLVKPEKENAVKFETFVFDALPFAKTSLNLEVRREHEFAPLKNAEGIDSVETCKQLLSNYFCEWLATAGVPVLVPGICPGPEAPMPVVEISPLYSLDAGELATKIKPEGLKLERRLLLD